MLPMLARFPAIPALFVAISSCKLVISTEWSAIDGKISHNCSDLAGSPKAFEAVNKRSRQIGGFGDGVKIAFVK